MTVRTGSCLCGARVYEIDGDLDGVWVCHCSLCRKASGANGNWILIVPAERFRWIRGEDHGVTTAQKPDSTPSMPTRTPLARKAAMTAGRETAQA